MEENRNLSIRYCQTDKFVANYMTIPLDGSKLKRILTTDYELVNNSSRLSNYWQVEHVNVGILFVRHDIYIFSRIE